MKYSIFVFLLLMAMISGEASTPVQVNTITHKIFVGRQLGIDETICAVEKAVAMLPNNSFVSYRLPFGMTAYTSRDDKGVIETIYIDGEFGPWDVPSFDGYVEYDLVHQ